MTREQLEDYMSEGRECRGPPEVWEDLFKDWEEYKQEQQREKDEAKE